MTEKTTVQPSLFRRLLFLIFLIALLLGLNILYVQASSWRGVLSGDAATVLYAAGFDGFQDEWRQYQGRESATIENGVLQISVESSANVIYSPARPYFADFDLTVDAKALSGAENNAYGVVFRLQEAQNDCRLPLIFLCDLAQTNSQINAWAQLLLGAEKEQSGFMMFLISSDGFYSLWQGTAEGSRQISTWIPTEAIQLGLEVDNQLRIVARGNDYQFFINGTQVELCIPNEPTAQSTYYLEECLAGTMQSTLTDSSFPTGQIALVIDSHEGADTFSIAFDNLVITTPTELATGSRS